MLSVYSQNDSGADGEPLKRSILSPVAHPADAAVSHPFPPALSDCRREVETACTLWRKTLQRLSLSQICHQIGLSKSTLLRAFTKSKGVTPYHYLENIRVEAAKSYWSRESLPQRPHFRRDFLIKVILRTISAGSLVFLPVPIGTYSGSRRTKEAQICES